MIVQLAMLAEPADTNTCEGWELAQTRAPQQVAAVFKQLASRLTARRGRELESLALTSNSCPVSGGTTGSTGSER